MKYTCVIEIDAPVDKVAALWNNETHFAAWQDGFVSIESVSGTPGTAGAKAKIKFQQGKRKMELLETIITSDLPREKTALYEHIDMTNTQTTRFKALGDHKTQYTSEVIYTQFNGMVPKLMARFFPGVFKKQSLKWMHQFKAFAESTIENK